MEEQFITVLGPVSSNWGKMNWNLFCAGDRIVACPYTFRESVQLAFRFSLHVWPPDPGEKMRALVERGISEFDLPRDRRLRRYPVHLLRSIVVQSNNTANTITFMKLSGEEDVYSIPFRNETDSYREALSDLYPSVYREKDFPTTVLGRLLKK